MSTTIIIGIVIRCIIRSKVHSTTKVLILWRRTMSSFDSIEIKLALVWRSAYTSFIHLNLISRRRRWLLFLHVLFTTVGLLIHFLSGVAKLIEFTVLDVHWLWLRATLWLIWRYHLCVVATSLRSSFDLILDLSLLFFVRVSNLNTLTDLLMLWSIQRSHLLRILIYHILNRRIMLNVSRVNIWIFLSFLSRILSISSLSRQSSWCLSLTDLIWICSIQPTSRLIPSCYNLSLISHLLLFLLLLSQLSRS